MATWERTYSNGSNFTHWFGRLTYNLNSQNAGANTSNIYLEVGTHSESGAYTQSGTWDQRIYINGGQVARVTPSASVGAGYVGFTSWSGDVGHDGNGNLTINIGDYINAPVNEMTFAQIGWTLPRIPLAPSISDVSYTPGTIKPTTVQLRAETSSVGHGSSNTWTMFHRLQGAGGWTNDGAQLDGAGYNYWNLTSLKPGKTYEFYANATNNNGDSADSGIVTFKTQPLSGMLPILTALAG